MNEDCCSVYAHNCECVPVQFTTTTTTTGPFVLDDEDSAILETEPQRGSLIIPLTLGNGRKEELFFLTGRDVQEKEAQGGEAMCYKWLMVKEKGSSKCSTSSIF